MKLIRNFFLYGKFLSKILSIFVEEADISREDLRKIIAKSYSLENFNRHLIPEGGGKTHESERDGEILHLHSFPLRYSFLFHEWQSLTLAVARHSNSSQSYLLDLSQGPTNSFKDYALQVTQLMATFILLISFSCSEICSSMNSFERAKE